MIKKTVQCIVLLLLFSTTTICFAEPTLNYAIICKNVVDGSPVSETDEFYQTDNTMYLLFSYESSESFDATVEWYDPAGHLYQNYDWTVKAGRWAYRPNIDIYNSAPSKSYLDQNWEVVLEFNNLEVFRGSFKVLSYDTLIERLEGYDTIVAQKGALESQLEELEGYQSLYNSINDDLEDLQTDHDELREDYDTIKSFYETALRDVSDLEDELESKQGIPGFPIISIFFALVLIIYIIKHNTLS